MKTFLIALTVFAITRFIASRIAAKIPEYGVPTDPIYIKMLPLLWSTVMLFGVAPSFIVAWAYITSFPAWLLGGGFFGSTFFLITFFGGIYWFFNDGKRSTSINPHNYACGDRSPPGYDGP